MLQGRLDLAAGTYHETIALAQSVGMSDAPATGVAQVYMAEVLGEWNDLSGAEALVREGITNCTGWAGLANMALGAAYNNLYLVYVALFSASVYALALTLRSIDLQVLEARFSPAFPRRFPARFMLGAGAVPALLWLSDVVGQLVQGEATKHLDSYTTSVTYSLDLAIITPACFIAGFLLLRHVPLGYAMAFPLIGIIVMLVPGIIVSTISQLAAGVTLTAAEIVGPVAGFVILGLIAVWLLVSILRNISDSPPSTAPRA